jgi:hypothetical protein
VLTTFSNRGVTTRDRTCGQEAPPGLHVWTTTAACGAAAPRSPARPTCSSIWASTAGAARRRESREARGGRRASCGPTPPRRAVARAALLRLRPPSIATAPCPGFGGFSRRVRETGETSEPASRREAMAEGPPQLPAPRFRPSPPHLGAHPHTRHRPYRSHQLPFPAPCRSPYKTMNRDPTCHNTRSYISVETLRQRGASHVEKAKKS